MIALQLNSLILLKEWNSINIFIVVIIVHITSHFIFVYKCKLDYIYTNKIILLNFDECKIEFSNY